MKTSKASIVFPPDLSEDVKSSLREFMIQKRSWVEFEFRDDPAFREPAVESLEAAPGSYGSIDESVGLAVEAKATGLHEDLLREYRRIQRLAEQQGS